MFYPRESVFIRGEIPCLSCLARNQTAEPPPTKRLARYPQFYSRIGFVHEFRALSPSEIRQLLERHWTPPGVKLPGDAIDASTAASIIRITGGNFRLLNRLLTQVERILEINALPTVTKEVVEAARENLVIGQS